MTFEEWCFKNSDVCTWETYNGKEVLELMKVAWFAAKEDNKPVAMVIEQDKDRFYIDASDAFDCAEKYSTLWEYSRFYTKNAAEKWAIENGYRVEESQ